MSIQHAYAAVTARSTDGEAVRKSSLAVAQVNRHGAGTYSVHFVDDMVNTLYPVKVQLNAGDATHRFYGYSRVSRRQLDVLIMDGADPPVGLDVDFTIEAFADADASIGA